MIDFAVQRTNMVDSQVRPSDVTDRRIPRVMLEVPREAFIPGPQRATAYMDDQLKVAETPAGARFLLAPRVLAKLLQNLDLGDDAAVLDIGCATGYSTALLSRIAKSVVAVECDGTLAEQATASLKALGIANATVITGALEAGAPSKAPYDAILLNGAVPDIPAPILDQLKDGGRLVAIKVENGVGRATLWRRYGTQFDSRALFDAGAAALPGFAKPAGFVF